MIILNSAKTSTGVVRTENQDFFGVNEKDKFFFVCDGMGGAACGDFASKYATNVILSLFDKITKKDSISILGEEYSDYDENILRPITLIKIANRALYNMTKKYPKLAGMGTTCSAIWIEESKNLIHIYNVGDSRVYRIRNGKIQQLTQDHTKIKELIDSGKMTVEDSKVAEFQSMITRALGTMSTVKVDYKSELIRPGDVYILCTDGLNGELSDFTINDIVTLHKPNVEEISSELILAANNSGGRDNTTVISVCAKTVTELSENEKIVQQKDFITFDEEKSHATIREDSLIHKNSRKFTVPIPELATNKNIFKSPLVIALILVVFCMFGIFTYSFFSNGSQKDIVALTGNISGIMLDIRTIKEDKLKEITGTTEKVFKMQILQNVLRNADAFTEPLANVGVVVSVDGMNKFISFSEYKPLEIKLPEGRYMLTLRLEGYKILDENLKLKDSIELMLENSKVLSDKVVIMVQEKYFKNI
ncbi:MAG: serine/threonine-protein phosphatase [Elusimicrobia bacterium]|nr:serine/threonine-protein phosphatase [Elusimicrobiota bacterium]